LTPFSQRHYCPLAMVKGVRRPMSVALAAALTLTALGEAYAAEATEDDLIKQGVELRKRNEDEPALAAFRRAYDIGHSPRAAAQIGLAEMALGRWADAESHLKESLSAPSDPWIGKNIETLKTTLDQIQSKLGDLDIVGGPIGAEVVIEGESRGTLPLKKPVRVRIGQHQVDLKAPGYTPASIVVVVTAEHLTRERLVLLPNVSGNSPVAPDSGDSPPAGSRPNRRRWLAWGAAIGAVPFFAGGVIAVLASNDRYEAFNNQRVPGTNDPLCSRAAPDRGGSYCQTLLAGGDRDKLRRLRRRGCPGRSVSVPFSHTVARFVAS